MSGNGRTLTRPSLLKPTVFDELFKPWTQLFDDRWPSATQLPAVNIRETDNEYEIRLAAPGLEKNDFKIRLPVKEFIIRSVLIIKDCTNRAPCKAAKVLQKTKSFEFQRAEWAWNSKNLF